MSIKSISDVFKFCTEIVSLVEVKTLPKYLLCGEFARYKINLYQCTKKQASLIFLLYLTFPQSNIPMIVGQYEFYSKILRFGNTCTNLDKFILSLNKIFRKLSKIGFEHSNLIHIIKRCIRKNNIVFVNIAYQTIT